MPRVAKLALLILVLSLNAAKAQSTNNNHIHYITNNVSKFDSIAKRFRGQVIYVDMWATWCISCRKELQNKKHIAAFATFAAKNKVAVIYLSWDKAGKSWQRFVNANELYGYHILVTDSLHKDLQERFSTDHIGNVRYAKKGLPLPRHIIIDRNGAIADSAAAEQDSKYVYDKISALLIN